MAKDPSVYDPVAVTQEAERPGGAGTPPDRTGPSVCHVIDHRGAEQVQFSREMVEQLLATGGFFWLDLDQPSGADFAILRDVFKFHPLAVEDSEQFDQRAKIDDYDDFIL